MAGRDTLIRGSLLLSAVMVLGACGSTDIELLPGAGKHAAGMGSSVTVVLGDAPAASPELFASATDEAEGGMGVPRIAYPIDGAVMPRDVVPPHVQWTAPDELDLFEVRVSGELSSARYYTTQRELPASASGLRDALDMHAGHSLEITVRGLSQAAPAQARRSASVTLQVAAQGVPGEAYYWSTTSQGIARAPLSAANATRVFTAPAAPDAATCSGCHAISRDATKLAVGYNGERLRIVSLPKLEVLVPKGAAPEAPITVPEPTMMMPKPKPMPGMTMTMTMTPAPAPVPAGIAYGWGAFDPSGARLLYADKGALHLIDALTGNETSKVTLPSGKKATHPDWSPDGSFVVVTYGDKAGDNKNLEATSLARLPVQGDQLGEPELLVQSKGKDDTVVFPAYSPDGKWIAFARAKGKSKDSKHTELWVVDAEGKGEPIALERANTAGVDTDAKGEPKDVASTMPSWAASAEADRAWLVFSSQRAYGTLLATGAHDQLWMAGVDTAALARGEDGSSPALWLPFQELDEDNHRALWVTPSDASCVPGTPERCDEQDDDCDGKVDEDCCTPQPEQCGNGKDDDCDGLVDDHCGCAPADLCDNGIDDDCDTNTDEDCVL